LQRCAGVQAHDENSGCVNIVQAKYLDKGICVAFVLILGSRSAI